MFKNLNTVGQGSVGLSAAIYYYQSSGYMTSIPLVDNSEYDLVIEKNSKFFTIQVKTTGFFKNNSYLVQLKSIRSNKNKNFIKAMKRVDFVFILCENGDLYSIPFDALINKTTNKVKSGIALNAYEKYKVMQTKHISND